MRRREARKAEGAQVGETLPVDYRDQARAIAHDVFRQTGGDPTRATLVCSYVMGIIIRHPDLLAEIADETNALARKWHAALTDQKMYSIAGAHALLLYQLAEMTFDEEEGP